ncbi:MULTISPECIES: hypothetical protein [unclassified Acinetobacter]|nr:MULTISPECIES: hypothetical protein [unclassified Acinetobacter]
MITKWMVNRVDAAIGFKNEDWSASFAVNNLTDEKYWRFTAK